MLRRFTIFRDVGIRLYKNGIHVSDQTLQDGEDYIHEDEIRVTVLEFSVPSSDWTTDLPERSRWNQLVFRALMWNL